MHLNIINPFLKSITQFSDPVFRKVLVRALILSILVFICLTGIVWFALSETSIFSFWFLEIIADTLGGITVIFMVWLLFPAVASFFVTLFLEDIVDAVEKRHYPDDPPAQPVKLSKSMSITLRFTSVTIALNLLALPFYFFTIWFPPIAIGVFYCLNGYLFGREYFEIVAPRRLNSNEIASVRNVNKWKLFSAGLVITFLFTIPFINLFVPVIGVAALTHVFKSIQRPEVTAIG